MQVACALLCRPRLDSVWRDSFKILIFIHSRHSLWSVCNGTARARPADKTFYPQQQPGNPADSSPGSEPRTFYLQAAAIKKRKILYSRLTLYETERASLSPVWLCLYLSYKTNTVLKSTLEFWSWFKVNINLLLEGIFTKHLNDVDARAGHAVYNKHGRRLTLAPALRNGQALVRTSGWNVDIFNQTSPTGRQAFVFVQTTESVARPGIYQHGSPLKTQASLGDETLRRSP